MNLDPISDMLYVVSCEMMTKGLIGVDPETMRRWIT